MRSPDATSVQIAYGPSGNLGSLQDAVYLSSKDYWYLDWTIPQGTTTGPYDVRVVASNNNGETQEDYSSYFSVTGQEPTELYYDDGSANYGFINAPGAVGAVKFTVSNQVQVLKLKFYNWGESRDMNVYVLDANLNVKFSDKVTFYEGWFEVDIENYDVFVNGAFYVVAEWISDRPWIGVDNDPPHHQRSYLGNINSLIPAGDTEDFMIRVIVR